MANKQQDLQEPKGRVVPKPIFPGDCPPLKRAEELLNRVADETAEFERTLEKSRSDPIPD